MDRRPEAAPPFLLAAPRPRAAHPPSLRRCRSVRHSWPILTPHTARSEAMSAPVRQPRTPSPAPQAATESTSAGFTNPKPPHLGRQSLGPPPTHRSHSGPLSPGSGLLPHASHLQHQRASLAGDKLAEARAGSPRVVSSGYGNGNGLSAGLGAGLRNVSAGSALSGNGYMNGSGMAGGLRPQSEYIGGLASGVFGKEHQMAEGMWSSVRRGANR